MTYEKRLLQPILSALNQKRIHADALAARRRSEIYETLPEVAEIDAKLQNTVLEIVKHAFSHGEDVRAPLAAVRDQNLALQRERAQILQKAGYPADHTEPQYTCTACSDTGYVGQDVCACVDRAYRAALVDELSESIGFAANGFEDFRLDLYSDLGFGGKESPRAQMAEVLAFCKNYAQNFGKKPISLLMTGETGSGKTLLSACIAHAVVKNGASVVFDSAFRLFNKFEEERFGRAEENTTRRYYDCDLLVIDGLGGEVVSQYSAAVLGDLLDARELRGKPVLINTSLSSEELRTKYKKQLASRMDGGFVKVPLFGQNNRGK